MVYYIENKYNPTIPNMNTLNTKQKILNVTGPDAFTKAVNNEINSQQKKLHRNINYKNFFVLCSSNYRSMYTINNKKHYSELNLPLYK
jgi:hypothetical protein